MATHRIRRGTALLGSDASGAAQNPVYIDSVSERFRHAIGTSGQTLRNLSATVATNVTSVGNGADQTEDNLQTISLNAGALNNVGDYVVIEAFGRTGANGDSKDIKVYFGATVVASVAASTANAKNWYAYVLVVKTASNAQLAFGTLQVDTTAGAIQRSTPAETDTAAITIKTTGKENTASTANSILSDLLTVEAA